MVSEQSSGAESDCDEPVYRGLTLRRAGPWRRPKSAKQGKYTRNTKKIHFSDFCKYFKNIQKIRLLYFLNIFDVFAKNLKNVFFEYLPCFADFGLLHGGARLKAHEKGRRRTPRSRRRSAERQQQWQWQRPAPAGLHQPPDARSHVLLPLSKLFAQLRSRGLRVLSRWRACRCYMENTGTSFSTSRISWTTYFPTKL